MAYRQISRKIGWPLLLVAFVLTGIEYARFSYTQWGPADVHRLNAHADLLRLAGACHLDTREPTAQLTGWVRRKFQPYPEQFLAYMSAQLSMGTPPGLMCDRVADQFAAADWGSFSAAWWHPAESDSSSP